MLHSHNSARDYRDQPPLELYTLQDSGAANHLRDFEMRGVTSSNTTCNEAAFYYATENERGAPKKKKMVLCRWPSCRKEPDDVDRG